LAPSWKEHLVHPKKRHLDGHLAQLGEEGLNRSKLISRQEKIQVPTAELQTTELASIPAFVRSHNILTFLAGYRCIKIGDFFGIP
jgi:hypothetical protein